MDTAERFIQILEEKDLVDRRITTALRAKLAQRPGQLPVESIAQYLVKQGHLTFAVAQRVLQQASTSSKQAGVSERHPPDSATTKSDEANTAISASDRSVAWMVGAAAIGGIAVFGVAIGAVAAIWAWQSEPEPPPRPVPIAAAPTPVAPAVDSNAEAQRLADSQLAAELAAQREAEAARQAEAMAVLRELRESVEENKAGYQRASTSDDEFALVDQYLETMGMIGDAASAVSGDAAGVSGDAAGVSGDPAGAAAARATEQGTPTRVVRVSADGRMTLDRQPVKDAKELTERLGRTSGGVDDAQVLVQAHPDCSSRTVLDITRAVQEAGIEKILMAVEEK